MKTDELTTDELVKMFSPGKKFLVEKKPRFWASGGGSNVKYKDVECPIELDYPRVIEILDNFVSVNNSSVVVVVSKDYYGFDGESLSVVCKEITNIKKIEFML